MSSHEHAWVYLIIHQMQNRCMLLKGLQNSVCWAYIEMRCIIHRCSTPSPTSSCFSVDDVWCRQDVLGPERRGFLALKGTWWGSSYFSCVLCELSVLYWGHYLCIPISSHPLTPGFIATPPAVLLLFNSRALAKSEEPRVECEITEGCLALPGMMHTLYSILAMLLWNAMEIKAHSLLVLWYNMTFAAPTGIAAFHTSIKDEHP